MKVVINVSGVKNKYARKSQDILDAAEALGSGMDVSEFDTAHIHTQIAALPDTESVLILGGYDLVPTFVLNNPTLHIEQQNEGDAAADMNIPSDGPFGGIPGNKAQQLLPTRPVARVPDGPAAAVDDFLTMLKNVTAKPNIPDGAFQEAAQEFEKQAIDVAKALNISVPLILSPPTDVTDPTLPAKVNGKGKIHILLHGANYSPDWANLWGHASESKDWLVGLSSQILRNVTLAGSVITFSSCYAAMIDLDSKNAPVRDSTNQVSMACLYAGAKAVFAVTRSNWIGETGSLLGPGLATNIWKGLLAGKKAGQALIDAKRQLASDAMTSCSQEDLPYVYKTLAQAQFYGNPEATL
ncbi:MAG: C25 family cysteine peptidase [Smithella sp.]